MTGKTKLFMILPLLITVGCVLLHLFTAPPQLVIMTEENDGKSEYVYFKSPANRMYSDKFTSFGSETYFAGTFFNLPQTAFLDSLRIDFISGNYSFRIREMKFLKNHFFQLRLPAEKLVQYYEPNSHLHWKMDGDSLLATVNGNDPFIVPFHEKFPLVFFEWKLIPERVAGIFFLLIALYLLMGAIYFYRPISGFVRNLAPWNWYIAFLIFAGALLLMITPLTGSFTSRHYITCAVVLLFFLFLHLWEVIQQKIAKKEQADLAAPPAAAVKKKRDFDMTMAYFRAFAILCIVIGHYLEITYYYPLPDMFRQLKYAFFVALFSNDTIYFLFISGYLFYYLTDRFSGKWEGLRFIPLTGKFDLKSFYWKKIKNVISPYLVFSLAIAYLISITGDISGYVGQAFFWSEIPEKLLKGGMQIQYWYIPFIAIVFIFAPILLIISKKAFYGILILSVICTLCFSRTPSYIHASDFLFFGSAFLMGMWYALDKEKIFPFFQKFFWYFLVAAIICSCVIFSKVIDPSAFPSDQIRALHKWCMIPVVIVLLEKLKNKKIPFLISVANLSFTLYFLHMFIMQKVFCNVSIWLFQLGFTSTLELCIARLFAGLVFLYLVSWSLKVLTGRYSRSLIGS